MNLHEDITLTVEAEARLPVASAQLLRLSLSHAADHVRSRQQTYRVDLGLTPRPRNARACYRDRWSPRRFEKIGQLLILPPGETVQTQSDAIGLQRSVVCYLHPDPIREWFDGDLEWTDRGLESSLDVRDTNIRDLLRRLASELQTPGLASDLLLGLIAAQLALELGRFCARIDPRATRGGLAQWRMRLIESRLNEVRAPPTLTELAALCNLSVAALTRGFRVSKGMSIGEYVTQHQLSHASQMLAAGQSVKAVAYALGFGSSASFCHAFRRASGETPGRYRQRTRAAARLKN